MTIDTRGVGFTSQRARDRLVGELRERGITCPRVLEAIRTVPRHLFVDEALASRAYENCALPIGFNQTISQPFIVARMTAAIIESGPHAKVLEVGGGCGYQTAVLARFCDRVYVVERIAQLANALRDRMYQLRINNIRVSHRDGLAGWPEHAPFDAILCAAAPPVVPEDLLAQLTDGGRLVIPVGSGEAQQLLRITRHGREFSSETLEAVTFVPMLNGIS